MRRVSSQVPHSEGPLLARRPLLQGLVAGALAGVSARPLLATRAAASGAMTQEAYIEALSGALDVVTEKLEAARARLPRRKKPLEFSSQLFFAHGAFYRHFSQELLLQYAEALVETGLQRVDLNIAVNPWLEKDQENIAKYDAVLGYFKQAGVKVALNPEVNRGAFEIRRFSDWGGRALEIYPEIVRRYRPDTFTVIHEPTTMAARMGIRVGLEQWWSFIRKAARSVRAAAPGTRVAAGVHTGEFPHFARWVPARKLDLIAVNVFTLKGLKTVNRMIALAGRHGVPMHIEETWRFPLQDGADDNLEDMSTRTLGNGAYQDLDIKWLKTIALYADVMGLEAVTPFWSPTFFHYSDQDLSVLDPVYNAAVAQAIAAGERTRMYSAFQETIRHHRSP